MPIKNIGKKLKNGFAGSYTRHPDYIVASRVASGELKFGTVVYYSDDNGTVKAADASFTAEKFAGVVCAEVKSSINYIDQNYGSYKDKSMASIMQRGSVTVANPKKDAGIGKPVYVCIIEEETNKVGDLLAAAGTTGANYKLLTNCQWGSNSDENGNAELVILTRLNA